MEELAKIKTGGLEARRERAAFGAAGARWQRRAERAVAGQGVRCRGRCSTGLIVTKLDGTGEGRRAVCDCANSSRLPVHFVGVGEAVDDLRPFEPESSSTRCLRVTRTDAHGQIEFRDVTKRFDNGTEALRSVSVSFEEGSMTFLTGHSGAGKSTFLRLLLRLDLPTRGQILVNGVNIAQLAGPAYSRVPAEHRCGVSGSSLARASLRVRQRRGAAARGGMHERDVARRARAALSRVGLLEKERLLPPTSVDRRAAASRHRARARESTARCCSRTNRPAIWIRNCRATSCGCSSNSRKSARR